MRVSWGSHEKVLKMEMSPDIMKIYRVLSHESLMSSDNNVESFIFGPYFTAGLISAGVVTRRSLC